MTDSSSCPETRSTGSVGPLSAPPTPDDSTPASGTDLSEIAPVLRTPPVGVAPDWAGEETGVSSGGRSARCVKSLPSWASPSTCAATP